MLEPVLTNPNLGKKENAYGITPESQFKMFLVTKMANPHFLPEVFIRVTVINFTVTEQGLEEQLLTEIVKRENPELENKKKQLILAISNDQKRMR